MIDEWVSKVVSDDLASGRSHSRINHYWMVKNMLVLLMEDMPFKWNGARELAQCMCTGINQTDRYLRALEAKFNLRHYSLFPSASNTDGDGEKDQRGKGGETLTAAGYSSGMLQEHRGNTRIATPIKRGR